MRALDDYRRALLARLLKLPAPRRERPAQHLLAVRLRTFRFDLKRRLRTEKADIEFHEEVHLPQDHWHFFRLRPCKRKLYRRKRLHLA